MLQWIVQPKLQMVARLGSQSISAVATCYYQVIHSCCHSHYLKVSESFTSLHCVTIKVPGFSFYLCGWQVIVERILHILPPVCTYVWLCKRVYIMLNVSWKTSMESPFSARGFQVTKSCNKSETLLKSNGCQTVRDICSINVNRKKTLMFDDTQTHNDFWHLFVG